MKNNNNGKQAYVFEYAPAPHWCPKLWFHLFQQAHSTAALKIAEHALKLWRASNTIFHYSRQWKAINKSVLEKNKPSLLAG